MPINAIKKPLHLTQKRPVRKAIRSTRPTNYLYEAAKQLASNAPNQADPNDGRGFKGNQSRLEEDEERRKEIYRRHLLNLIKARRNRR